MSWLTSIFSSPKPLPPTYCDSVNWIPGAKKLCDILPTFADLRKVDYANLLPSVGDFAYQHKEVLAAAIFVGVTAVAVKRIMKSRAPKPLIVKMETSLNHATLSIQIPEKQVIPPNATVTLCIDTSGSMKGPREQAVKEGLDLILDRAQQVIKEKKRSQIQISAVGFNDESSVLLKPTKLSLNGTIQKIRDTVKSYSSEGGTKILVGLHSAIDQLNEMTLSNPTGNHTLILLSDGDEAALSSSLKPIHQKLAKAQAHLYAIGIGENHNKETLLQIAANDGKFTGTYIDASKGTHLITEAISSIFEEALAPYNLQLNSTQLPPQSWSVNGKRIQNNGIKLKPLSEGEGRQHIEIHTDLAQPLDLRTVSLNLNYTALGKKGTISIPWNPNPIIDPAICHPERA